MNIFSKKMIGMLMITGLFLACEQGTPAHYDIEAGSSSIVSDESSSSSISVTSSSSIASENSSSSMKDVSSEISSSSVLVNSSSSEFAVSSSSLDAEDCTGFVDGSLREHYGKEKPQFCDERDGKKYVYVEIDGKNWMAENLQYKPSEVSDFKCYNDDPDHCDYYGVLYRGTIAPDVCPEGWHLPSDSEWSGLANYATGAELKSNTDDWVSGKGTDYFGFTALPTGFFDITYGDNDYIEMGKFAGYWSSNLGTILGSGHVYHIKNYRSILELIGFYLETDYIPVRCVKD